MHLSKYVLCFQWQLQRIVTFPVHFSCISQGSGAPLLFEGRVLRL